MTFEEWWDGFSYGPGTKAKWMAQQAWEAALRNQPEGGAIKEAFEVIFSNMDANGDPVGAQPETSWENGYAAGLRYAYRVLKQRGIALPASTPQMREESK